mmetsp:Transcript_19790/g.49423  ORF Transcript_19790/g.49423 Transcript_19790/m.49423 type:complete len:150 (-) Transcript_19790:313-762(-)
MVHSLRAIAGLQALLPTYASIDVTPVQSCSMVTAAYSAGTSHIAPYAPVLPSATAITTNRASATFPATRQSDSSRISTLHSVFSRVPCWASAAESFPFISTISGTPFFASDSHDISSAFTSFASPRTNSASMLLFSSFSAVWDEPHCSM